MLLDRVFVVCCVLLRVACVSFVSWVVFPVFIMSCLFVEVFAGVLFCVVCCSRVDRMLFVLRLLMICL